MRWVIIIDGRFNRQFVFKSREEAEAEWPRLWSLAKRTIEVRDLLARKRWKFEKIPL